MNWPDSELRRALYVENNRLDLAAWRPGEQGWVKIRDDVTTERTRIVQDGQTKEIGKTANGKDKID